MDVLNSLGVIIGIISGLFGIGGYIVAMVFYFRNKAASSQRKQTAQFQPPQRQYSYQLVSYSLSKLDWMEILWHGVEDFCRAYTSRQGFGWTATVISAICVFFANAIIASSVYVPLSFILISILVILYFTSHLLFYVYFVGREIEKKVADINQPLTQRSIMALEI